MDPTRFPVSIITQKLIKPKLEVYYPQTEGLTNLAVQQKINITILNLVNSLIVTQGYYQNPLTEISGWYEIKTNERGVLSLSLGVYTYSGGAHGLTIIKSLTFDILTGKSYQLADLFKPDSNYVKILSDIVKVQITEQKVDLLGEFKEIRPDQDYYIADKALVLYFQLYEITPYAYGFPYFPISVYEIEDIINEKGPLAKMLGSF